MTENLILLDEKTIKDKMYYIRGMYVMIDSDLAEIYGYTTKAFNQQVKNNINKFESDFMFQLTEYEYNSLRSKKLTLNGRGQHKKYLPYAFTEQGIYMLMTVLKGEKATEQSKTLIRIFKKMKDYLVNNNLLEVNNILLRHDNKINFIYNEIELLKESFEKIEEKELKSKIFFNGEIFDSYIGIIKILNKANKEIIIIDNYADETILEIISKINKKTILITNKKLLKDIDINKYNEQYHNLKVIKNNDFHDRFIILDKEKIYHIGSSINHLGNKTVGINLLEEVEVKRLLNNKINNIVNKKV